MSTGEEKLRTLFSHDASNGLTVKSTGDGSR